MGPYGGQVTSIAIDPVNPEKMFAATYQGDGLFVSKDRGMTWKPVPGFRNYDNRQIAIDQNKSSRVWSVYAALIARSDDGGNTWSRWRLSDTRPAFAIAVHPSNSQTVYVGTGGTFNSTENGSVYKTIDGGSTWQQTALAADKAITALVINPSIPDEIWVVSGWNENGSVYRSENGGTDWSQVDIGFEGEKVHQIVIDPQHPLVLYLSGSFGLLKSVDGGLNWDGAGVTDRCHTLTLDPDNPDIVYAATSNEPEPAFFKSINTGDSWTKTSLADLGRLLTLTIDAANNGRLFAGSYNAGIYASGNGGQTWQASGEGITANIVHDSSIHPGAPREILVGTESGIFRRDSQNVWHRLSIEESYAVAHDPYDARIIYSGRNYNLAKSIDDGTSWTETEILDLRDEITSVASIAVDPLDSQVLCVGADYSKGNKGEVYKSEDGGQTLVPVLPLTVPVNTVAVSAADHKVIFAGSGSFYASAFDREGGVYRSEDSGSTSKTGSTTYGMIYKGDTTEVAYPAEAWLDVGLDTPFRALIWDTGHYLIAKPPVGDDYILNCQTDNFYDQITGIRVWSMAELNYDFHLKPGSRPLPATSKSGGGGGGCFIETLRH